MKKNFWCVSPSLVVCARHTLDLDRPPPPPEKELESETGLSPTAAKVGLSHIEEKVSHPLQHRTNIKEEEEGEGAISLAGLCTQAHTASFAACNILAFVFRRWWWWDCQGCAVCIQPCRQGIQRTLVSTQVKGVFIP